MKLTLAAPAKLNLFLHITGCRNDGYHELQTLFQLLDYGDTLDFTLKQEPEIQVDSTYLSSAYDTSSHKGKGNFLKTPNIPLTQNLIFRAAKLLQTYTGTQMGAHIQLHKRLPIGGGIGGGSSNAATTLVGLNQLWQTQLSTEVLAELGRQIGADVPVFVRGHTAWAEGIGDILTPVNLPTYWYVVLAPPCEIITKDMYSHPQLPRHTPKISREDYLFREGHHDFTTYNEVETHNDFETLAIQLYPEVKEALKWLGQFNPARMTGSGSCIFTRFSTEQEALDVLKQIPPPYRAFAAKGVNASPLIAGDERKLRCVNSVTC